MEVPKYKAAQHETIQEACAKFFETGEEVETVKQGQMKEGKKTEMGVSKNGKIREKKL